MGDFELVSPDGQHVVVLTYEGEPPHGDSFHTAVIDGQAYPDLVWGGMVAFSACSRHLAFNAMPSKWQRVTAVVDLVERRHTRLPRAMRLTGIAWPTVSGEDAQAAPLRHTFDGRERWTPL